MIELRPLTNAPMDTPIGLYWEQSQRLGTGRVMPDAGGGRLLHEDRPGQAPRVHTLIGGQSSDVTPTHYFRMSELVVPSPPPAQAAAGREPLYSVDEERYVPRDELMELLAEDHPPGAVCEVSMGVARPLTHASFIDGARIIEMVTERAANTYGEHADEYLDKLEEACCCKADDLKAAVAEWFAANAPQPRFHGIHVLDYNHLVQLPPAAAEG